MTEDWMHLMIEVPVDTGQGLLEMFTALGFREVDWCEMQRPDFARVSWGPCAPRTSTGFATPPDGLG